MKNLFTKKNIIFLILFVLCLVPLFGADPKNVYTNTGYLNSTVKEIIGVFEKAWVKGLLCIFLIGEAIALIYSCNGNTNVFKKLLPIFVGTLVFICAGKITSTMFYKKMTLLTNSQLPTFNKYLDTTKGAFNLLNLPLAYGFSQFTTILSKIKNIVLTFTILFCFLNIVFNAFKLWAGTIEIKKVFVDILYKCLFVFMFLYAYPKIQLRVFSLGSSIGATIGDQAGLDKQIVDLFNSVFTEYANSVSSAYEQMKLHPELVDPETGKSFITRDTLNKISQQANWNASQVEAFLKKRNMSVVDPTFVREKDGFSMFDKVTNSKITGTLTLNNATTIKETDEELAKDAAKAKGKLKAFVDICCGIDLETALKEQVDFATIKKKIENSMSSLWVNYYYISDNGNATFVLAPSNLFRIAIFVLQLKLETAIQEVSAAFDSISLFDLHLGTILMAFFNVLLQFLLFIIGIVGIAYILVSYAMTTFEYLITTSLAVLYIPFFFLDSVKNYAQNVIGLFIKFWTRLVVSVFLLFWSFNLLLPIFKFQLNAKDSFGTNMIAFATIAFTTMMTAAVGLLSEKIANTLCSGNPSLGAGDVKQIQNSVQQAHDRAEHKMDKAGEKAEKQKEKIKALGAGAKGLANNIKNGIEQHKENKKNISNRANEIKAKNASNGNVPQTKDKKTGEMRNMTEKEQNKAATSQAKKELKGTQKASNNDSKGQQNNNIPSASHKTKA